MTDYAFDPFFTGANEEDPYPVYRRLRDETPFYRDDRWDLWVISRFDDVQDALRDWHTYSQEPDVDIDGFMEDLLEPDGNILVMDPSRHGELRKLVQGTGVFAPKAIKDMEPQVTRIVDDLLDRFADAGSADAVEDFSYPIPLQVGPVLIGFPAEDLPMIDAWQRQTHARRTSAVSRPRRSRPARRSGPTSRTSSRTAASTRATTSSPRSPWQR